MNTSALRWIIGLWIAVALVGCAAGEERGVVNECLRKAVHFAFDDTVESVPPCLVKHLGKRKMVIVGEVHYVKEHGRFLSRLLERLHAEGFRWYLQEVGTAEGAVINAYLQGMPVTIREDFFAYDREMIEHLAAFNQKLRNEGRGDEQIQYAGFDLNHLETFDSSVRELCRLYSGKPAAAHLDPCELIEIAHPELRDPEKEMLRHLVESEKESRSIRKEWSHDRREAFMEAQLLYRLGQTGKDEKILVNTGIFHAQLTPEWTLDEDREFRWLAMRMKDHLSEEQVYAIGVNLMCGELLRSWHSTEKVLYEADTGEECTDLMARLHTRYPGRMIFIDFRTFNAPEEKVLVQNPFRQTEIPLRSHFDGMLVYPDASPLENPMIP